MLSVSIVGPVEVRRTGQPVPIPRGKPAELLVRLALEAGQPVSVERVIEDLWGDGAAATRRNTVQSKVARLRRALGDPNLVVADGAGYRLAVDPGQIDALSLPLTAAEARAQLDRGEAEAARITCAEALALFRGDLLPAAGEHPWAAGPRARLEMTRLVLLETSCAARSALGDPTVAADLEVLLADHPYQESLWGLLITDLYRRGQPHAALGAYHRVRARLADDLGLEPGPQLRELERQVLTHDAGLAPAPAPAPPVGAPPAGSTRPDVAPPAGNLPPLEVGLVGREPDLEAVLALVTHHRLVELVGPGGIGKTALALAAGRQLAAAGASGEVRLARLEVASTPDQVLDVVLAALGVTGGWAALTDHLARTPWLIILDNGEHLLDAVAALACRLLAAGPGLRLLVTSQVPLDVDGEVVYELGPLSLDDSVELFTRRAAAQRRARRDDAGGVTELCRSLDGLPLAIELAAARTRTLTVEEIVRRLDDRFALLHDPTSRKPERRRALRATIGWSYDLLFPDDQRGLWALATFAGGATLDGVEAVLGALDVPASAALDVVGRLVSRSLVMVDDDQAGSPVRYRLLDSVRAFALDARDAGGHAATAAEAHASWYAAVAAGSTAGVRSARQAEHLAFARRERADIDAAIAWAARHHPAQALDLVNGFGWAWVVLGDTRGAARISSALAAVGDGRPDAGRVTALLLLGWIEASTGDLAVARTHVAAAAEQAEALGDVELQARCCYHLAYVVSHDGEFRHALALTDRSRELYQDLDRPWDQAANALFAGRAAMSAADPERSQATVAEAGHWLARIDDPWLQVRYEALQGELARLQHRFDDAVQHLGRAVDVSSRLGFLQTAAYQTASLGRALLQTGRHQAGVDALVDAVARAEATGDARMAALARVHLGRALRTAGDDDGARSALEQAAGWHTGAGGGEQAALGDCLLAALDAAEGRPGAGDRLAELLAVARRDDLVPVAVFALDALARRAGIAGDRTAAADLLAQADELMPAAAHVIAEEDRVDAHHLRSTVTEPEDQVGPPAEERQW